MKKIISVLFAVSAVAVARAAAESTFTAAIDTRDDAARALVDISELLPLAWNSSTDWAVGGAAGTAVSIVATPMAGQNALDPTTWTVAGSPATIHTSVGGEGRVTWAPVRQNLYKVDLVVGEVETTVYFNLSETAGLASGKAISEDGAIVASATVLPATGLALTPQIVVTNGDKTLVEGTDYLVEYANNVNVGTATLTVIGIGDYKGTMSLDYTIAPVADVDIAQSAAFPDVSFDATKDPYVVYWRRGGSRAIAWNSSETFPVREHSIETLYYDLEGNIATNTVDYSVWRKNGNPDASVRSRVSVAPLESLGAEPGAFTVLKEASGEGTFNWKAKNGLWCFKLEKVDGNDVVTGTLTRTVEVRGADALIIQIR